MKNQVPSFFQCWEATYIPWLDFLHFQGLQDITFGDSNTTAFLSIPLFTLELCHQNNLSNLKNFNQICQVTSAI